MLDINISHISKMYEEINILDDISLQISKSEKVAIIGDNGCGKSTLLKLIVKRLEPTSGQITYRKGLKIGFLSQDIYDQFSNETVKEILNSVFKEENKVLEELKLLEEKLNTTDNLDKIIKKYCQKQEEFIAMGGYEIKSRIDKIISAFKLDYILDRSYNLLSGGEKTIVNLVCLLLKDYDVLILDEPTNHLDLDMLTYLENVLISTSKTLIIVSHDRYFLDKVTTKTILIDNHKLDIYHGNYSYYLKERENRLLKEFNDYNNQQKQIEAMKKSIKKLREFGRLAYPGGESFYKRAISIEKRLEKMTKLEKPKVKNDLNLSFTSSTRSGHVAVEIKDLTMGYSNTLLDKASLDVYYQDRICIIGKNGSGKSSLIKEIVKNNNPHIKIGSNIKIGYIPQENLFDDVNVSIIDEVKKYIVGEEHHIRSALSKFYFFHNDINRKIKNLSGGELVRLKLFILMHQDNNLLILDEISNHIDISTKEVLEEAINNFSGTVIAISHDRYLINSIATKVVEIKDQKLITHIGNYDDFSKSS